MSKEMSRMQNPEPSPEKKEERAVEDKLRMLARDFLIQQNFVLLGRGSKDQMETARETYARYLEDLEYFKKLPQSKISAILKEVRTEVNQDTQAVREEEKKIKISGLN